MDTISPYCGLAPSPDPTRAGRLRPTSMWSEAADASHLHFVLLIQETTLRYFVVYVSLLSCREKETSICVEYHCEGCLYLQLCLNVGDMAKKKSYHD